MSRCRFRPITQQTRALSQLQISKPATMCIISLKTTSCSPGSTQICHSQKEKESPVQVASGSNCLWWAGSGPQWYDHKCWSAPQDANVPVPAVVLAVQHLLPPQCAAWRWPFDRCPCGAHICNFALQTRLVACARCVQHAAPSCIEHTEHTYAHITHTHDAVRETLVCSITAVCGWFHHHIRLPTEDFVRPCHTRAFKQPRH